MWLYLSTRKNEDTKPLQYPCLQPCICAGTDISVKIPPRASEIFHAFQVADAVFVRLD